MTESSSPNIIYLGTPDFAVPPLEALLELKELRVAAVITQPDRPAGRGKKLTPPPVKKLASEFNVPVLQPAQLRKGLPELIETLSPLGPFHLAVVCAYGQILPGGFLTFPEHGCLNIHASLLPRWRGAAPIHRAILSGDKETGISLMQMDEGLDTGPVFSRHPMDIPDQITTSELHDHLKALAKKVLKNEVLDILAQKLHPEPQDEARATYANKITEAECLIDWSKDSLQVERQILGLSSTPGAFTFLGTRRVKVLYATHRNELSGVQAAASGEIVIAEKGRLEVKCNEGCIAIEKLQFEGKKVLSAEQLLRGNQVKSGMIFGS